MNYYLSELHDFICIYHASGGRTFIVDRTLAHTLCTIVLETPSSEETTRYLLITVIYSFNEQELWAFSKTPESEKVFPKLIKPLIELSKSNSSYCRYYVIDILNDLQVYNPGILDILIERLADDNFFVYEEAIKVLARNEHPKAHAALQARLHDSNLQVRQETISILVTKREPAEQKLLSLGLDGWHPWLDPLEPITQTRVAEAALALSLTEDEVRRCYEALAPDFALSLEWQQR